MKITLRHSVFLSVGGKIIRRIYHDRRDTELTIGEITSAWDKIKTIDDSFEPTHLDLDYDQLTIVTKDASFSLGTYTKDEFLKSICIVKEDSLEVFVNHYHHFGWHNNETVFAQFIENKKLPFTFEEWAKHKGVSKTAQWLQPSLRKEFEAVLEYRKEKIKIVTVRAEAVWQKFSAEQDTKVKELEQKFEKYCDWLGWELICEKELE